MPIYTNEFTNTGLMVFYSQEVTSSIVALDVDYGSSIENNGQICFHNHQYLQSSGIEGTGCMTAIGGGAIYLADPSQTFDSQHSFYLADGQSSLVVRSGGTGPLNVYGFGN
ncbi:hypothetical protein G210_3804, partial [Candida maltosa Xu316]